MAHTSVLLLLDRHHGKQGCIHADADVRYAEVDGGDDGRDDGGVHAGAGWGGGADGIAFLPILYLFRKAVDYGEVV
jgi:hypothetical protein